MITDFLVYTYFKDHIDNSDFLSHIKKESSFAFDDYINSLYIADKTTLYQSHKRIDFEFRYLLNSTNYTFQEITAINNIIYAIKNSYMEFLLKREIAILENSTLMYNQEYHNVYIHNPEIWGNDDSAYRYYWDNDDSVYRYYPEPEDLIIRHPATIQFFDDSYKPIDKVNES
jgi:hypothetical protein